MKYFLAGLVVLAILALIAVRFLRGRIPAEPKAASEWTPASVVPSKAADVEAFTITLEVNEKLALFLLLAADGTVNRMGSGTMNDSGGGHLFIGKINPNIFEAVRAHVTQPMLAHLGQTFQNQSSSGTVCKLSIIFQFKDGTSNGLGFLYGSESEQLPEDVTTLMEDALRRTDPWYENFKRSAEKQAP